MFVDAIHRLQPLRSLPRAVQFAATALVVLAFFGLRYLLTGLDEDPKHLPLFLIFVPGVILAALLFDKGAGYFAVALSSILGIYFFFDPRYPLGDEGYGDFARLGMFIFTGLLAAAIVEKLRKTVDELIERTGELAAARSQLEQGYGKLEAAAGQKELLLHDINHRIKNHLQLVSGYLLLGQREADERSAELLGNAANRLRVLARVYDRLQLIDEATSVNARGFIEELCSDLQPTVVGFRPIVLRAEAEDVELSSNRAVTIGLIINELVTKAVRYAYRDDAEGNIFVYLNRCEGGLCLEVIDDGDGFARDAAGGKGQRLLGGLVQQLGGTMERAGPPGTRVSIVFPEGEPGAAGRAA